MRNILCGLGFHRFEHIGYDVWKSRNSDNFFEIFYRTHRKCLDCDKRKAPLTPSHGTPPDVQINNDMTSYIDHSGVFMDEKPLIQKW